MHTDPSVYELAHLAGGPQRVAETALIALRDLGTLTITGPRVRATSPTPPARHPVEAVLTAFCSRGRGVAAAIAAVREAPETAEIGHRLRTLGLLTHFRHRPTRAGRRLLAKAESAGTAPGPRLPGPAHPRGPPPAQPDHRHPHPNGPGPPQTPPSGPGPRRQRKLRQRRRLQRLRRRRLRKRFLTRTQKIPSGLPTGRDLVTFSGATRELSFVGRSRVGLSWGYAEVLSGLPGPGNTISQVDVRCM